MGVVWLHSPHTTPGTSLRLWHSPGSSEAAAELGSGGQVPFLWRDTSWLSCGSIPPTLLLAAPSRPVPVTANVDRAPDLA